MKTLHQRIAGMLTMPLLFVVAALAWLFGAGGKRSLSAAVLGAIGLVIIGIPVVIICCAAFCCLIAFSICVSALAGAFRKVKKQVVRAKNQHLGL